MVNPNDSPIGKIVERFGLPAFGAALTKKMLAGTSR